MRNLPVALALVLVLYSAIIGRGAAQTNPPSPPPSSQICAVTSLSVSTSSARIAFPATSASCGVVTLKNNGTVDMFIAIGGSSVVADTSGTAITSIPLAAGDSIPVWTSGTYIAAITATGTTTLRVYKSNGPLGLAGSGSGGGGSSVSADPCLSAAKLSVPISQTTSTKLFSGVAGKKNYICSSLIVGADAENTSLVEGTGSICATNIAALIGGTTAASGMNFAANGGFGGGPEAIGTNNGFDVCLLQSGTGRVAGVISYVQQ